MTTAARTVGQDGSHWYWPTGKACYEIEKKDKSGMRPTTLADARKLGLVPSVTTILRVLEKPVLTSWLIEQACLAVLTTPKAEGEDIDTFVDRVLHKERVQDEESQKARDLGTDIHNAMEALLRGERIDDELRPWVEPAYLHLKSIAQVKETELILVGNGYAGRCDYIGQSGGDELIVDYKTTKKLPPKESWSEHRLQLSAYAEARWQSKQCIATITTANLYISTAECGKFVMHHNGPWADDYRFGFQPLVQHWQWSTGYTPPV